jgi:RNA polymerase sigma-70 factor (ECF subfamily)
MDLHHQTIAAAARGDHTAFDEIVRECTPPIYRYVCNLIGDQHAAEDIVQRVFVKLLSGMRQFDPERGSFSAWVYRIARNTTWNFARDRESQHVSFETSTPVASRASTPEEELELREGFAALDRAVAVLPDHQRSAWMLAELEGLSIAEISEIEGVTEGTIKSRVSRARAALQQSLSEHIGLGR